MHDKLAYAHAHTHALNLEPKMQASNPDKLYISAMK